MGNTIRVGQCWSRFSTLPPADPSLGISSLAGVECSRSSSIRNSTPDILPYRRRFQIRQSSERKHPETTVGNMQRFRGQGLEWVDVGWRQQQQLVSSTWHVFDPCICKSPVQDTLSWWKTDELGTFLICRGKWTKCILGLFQLMREEPDLGWILWMIAATCHWGRVENLGFFCMSSWENRCVTTIV